jgi:hypothetical protein
MVVFSRAWVDRPFARRKGVRVLPARMLVDYLHRLERRLSPQDIDDVHELIAEALLEHHAQVRAAGGLAGAVVPVRRRLVTRRRTPAVRGRAGR